MQLNPQAHKPVREVMTIARLGAAVGALVVVVAGAMISGVTTAGGTQAKATTRTEPKVLVKVPAGPFTCGDHDGQYDEKPVRIVHLKAFSIMREEVNEFDYKRCVVAGRCAPHRGPMRGDEFPVTGVSYKDAGAFCRYQGWRLPTEAEWEKAARGVDRRRFPWGGRDDRGGVGRASCGRGCNSALQTASANSDGASPYGALNMAGNVEEWVADWYGEGYGHTAPAHDPKGPTKGTYRVVRGGEFTQELEVLRTTNRYWAKPATYSDRRGFRCAK